MDAIEYVPAAGITKVAELIFDREGDIVLLLERAIYWLTIETPLEQAQTTRKSQLIEQLQTEISAIDNQTLDVLQANLRSLFEYQRVPDTAL